MVTALKTDFNSNLNNLTYLLDDEHKAISDTETTSDLEKLYQFSKTYHDHWFGMPTDKQFVKWTTDSKWAKFGLYPWIAYINADHFVSAAGQNSSRCTHCV